MLAADPTIQLILLFMAGAVWIVSKIVAASQNFRHRTRMRMERQERERTLEFEGETRSDDTAFTPRPELAPKPRLPLVRSDRPPSRTKKRIVRRRVIRHTVRKAAPQRPLGLLDRLRDVRSLREAIVLREILGPCKALRRQESR